jgi:hypothetical protein
MVIKNQRTTPPPPPHTPLDCYRKQETDPQRLSGWFLGFMTAILKKKNQRTTV